MRRLQRTLVALAMALTMALGANAQIYSIVNQSTSMLQAIFSGSRYRGMLEAGYMHGIGTNRADIVEITTTQGMKYTDWFFLGLGAGVDIMSCHVGNEDYLNNLNGTNKFTNNACMVPLYTDFRFNIGSPSKISFFIDVRLGAAFLMGKDYVQVGDGYINRSENFYLKPSIGLRIPLSSSNDKLALNVGASYQLITTEYWNGNDVSLNSLGFNLAFEW